MKKLLSILSGLALVSSVFGADSLSKLSMTISSEGPDLYADGTPVQVGETYLLVYIKTNAAFQGVLMDGALVDPTHNVIAATAKAIAGAKCEFKPLMYTAADYPSAGKWVLVLLDTRKADGTVGGLVVKVGSSVAMSAPAATALTIGNLGVSSSASGAPTLTANGGAFIPPSVQNNPPDITEITPNGAFVTIRFKNGGGVYDVKESADITSGAWVTAKARIQETANARIQGIAPATLSSDVPPVTDNKVRFFRVETAK